MVITAAAVTVLRVVADSGGVMINKAALGSFCLVFFYSVTKVIKRAILCVHRVTTG